MTEILSHFGEIRSIDFITHHPGTSKLKGVAYVRFGTTDEAKAALDCLAPSKTEKKDIVLEEEKKVTEDIKETDEK